MTKQKRMIYIYEENLSFYDELENKSEFINQALAAEKVRVPRADANNVDYVKERLAAIDKARQEDHDKRARLRAAQDNV